MATNFVFHTTFATAVPLAFNKNSNCYAGHRQTYYLIR